MKRVWLLNLDADEELARPDGYTAPARTRENVERFAARIVGLVPPGDALLGAPVTPGTRGVAWCPTPSAIRAFERAGIEPPRAPPIDVLRAVADRRFAIERFFSSIPVIAATTPGQVMEAIASHAPSLCMLKRAFGFAGRGLRKIDPRRVRDDDHAWIAGSLERTDAIVIEPLLDRTTDLAIHAFLSERGEITIGEATIADVDANGRWLASRRATRDEVGEDREALVTAAGDAARALMERGYFGPFGVDAFRFRREGRVELRAMCELNARYTMAWAIGMGDSRPDLAT